MLRTQQQIDGIIRDKHARGLVPSDIAPFVKWPAADVRRRLGDLGLVPHGKMPQGGTKARTAADVDRFIMGRADKAPSDIANALKLPTADVRRRMMELGLDVGDGSNFPKFTIHPMWTEFDDDDRRMAIWEQQRDGARRTRRANARAEKMR